MPRKHQVIQSSDNKGKLKNKKKIMYGGTTSFTITTHNIGQANLEWTHFNQINKPIKFEKGRKIKNKLHLMRNFFSYLFKNNRNLTNVPYDIFLLQEYQAHPSEIKNNTELNFGNDSPYIGHYTKTGDAAYLTNDAFMPPSNLEWGTTEYSNNLIHPLDHGAAVIWNKQIFSKEEEILNKIGFISRDKNKTFKNRASSWIILKHIKSKKKYAFLSIQCPVFRFENSKFVDTFVSLKESIDTLLTKRPDVLPIIGGDFNQDFFKSKTNHLQSIPNMRPHPNEIGFKDFTKLPQRSRITNVNWDIDSTNEMQKNDIITEKYIENEYDGCKDYLFLHPNISHSNFTVNQDVILYNYENNEIPNMKKYRYNDELVRDFDHASLSIRINTVNPDAINTLNPDAEVFVPKNATNGGKKTKKTKNVRKHKGIIQNGGNKGKLKKGYRYSGKRLKNGKAEIVKSKK